MFHPIDPEKLAFTSKSMLFQITNELLLSKITWFAIFQSFSYSEMKHTCLYWLVWPGNAAFPKASNPELTEPRLPDLH